MSPLEQWRQAPLQQHAHLLLLEFNVMLDHVTPSATTVQTHNNTPPGSMEEM